jgi:hypothetical protein
VARDIRMQARLDVRRARESVLPGAESAPSCSSLSFSGARIAGFDIDLA